MSTQSPLGGAAVAFFPSRVCVPVLCSLHRSPLAGHSRALCPSAVYDCHLAPSKVTQCLPGLVQCSLRAYFVVTHLCTAVRLFCSIYLRTGGGGKESIGRCEAKQVGAPGQPFRDRRPSPQRIVGDRRSRPVSRYGRHFPRAVLFHLPSPKPQREKRSNEERTKPMDQSIPPSTFTAGGSLRHLANLYEGAT